MISYEKAADLLDYNPDTGKLRWKKTLGSRAMAGDEAGCWASNGYLLIRVDNVLYKGHRLAWLLHYGKWPKSGLDHIDHDPSNNRIENLREAHHVDNLRNQSLRSTNTSGVCGVTWSKPHRKWCAYIKVDAKKKHLGLFDSIEEAASARAVANKQYNFHENHGT